MFKARTRAAEPAETEPAGTDRGAMAAQDTSASAPIEPRQPGRKIGAGVNAVRSRFASLIWLLAVVCALVLAIGALLVALKVNGHNSVASFILDGADKLGLGVFGREHGVFTFHGKDAAIKDALVNWGTGAIVYLVAGKIVDRVVRP